MEEDEINKKLRELWDKDHEKKELIKQITEDRIKYYKKHKRKIEYFISDIVIKEIELKEVKKERDRYASGFVIFLILFIFSVVYIWDFT